ncbi:MAG: DUF433 domain-containing protein [Gemmatimonadota bacterium]|nr:DUF433 domain-containing protein [Gemmatimonadota bacterium]
MKNEKIDARFAPAYGVSEAARYLNIPPSTLRSWISGIQYRSDRSNFEPVISVPPAEIVQLSFVNLVEAHVLVALRRIHKVRLQDIRVALDTLERQFPEQPHPLAFKSFATDGKNLFIEHIGQLINLSKRGQLEMEKVIDMYLHRIEHDASGPIILYPFTRDPFQKDDQPKAVFLNPNISFGRPVLTGRGVPTELVFERFNAGELMDTLAEDYGRERWEIEEAIRYESARSRKAA